MEQNEVIPGLAGIAAAKSEISYIDGEAGKLEYRGIDILELTEYSNFLETAFMLIYGELPDAADDCWYWTSTEVEGQETAKAWLFSMGSGAIQETPKLQGHKVRAIVTLYNEE
jgi:citrate synthase